jgi:hypothetical protein
VPALQALDHELKPQYCTLPPKTKKDKADFRKRKIIRDNEEYYDKSI